MNTCRTIIFVIGISTTIMLSMMGLVWSSVENNSENIREHELEPAHLVALEKFNNINEKVTENNEILKRICNGNCP